MNKNLKSNITIILLYSVIAVGYFWIVSQYIRVHDDLIYSLRLDNGLPIGTLSDIMYSNCYGYANQNGRFILHFFTQLLCNFDSMIPFYVISTLCFVGLVAGSVQLAYGHKFGLFVIPLFSLLLVLIVPSQGMTLYGNIAFVVNYLWTSCAIVWFLVLYSKTHYTIRIFGKIMLILLCIVCGSLQESFSIGLCAGLVFDFVINKNDRNSKKTSMALGFLVGACTCILAPGNFIRVQGSGFESSLVRRFILVLGEGWFIWVVLIVSCTLFLLRQRKTIIFVKRNIILYVAILTNFAFAVLVAYTFRHQLYSLVVMSLVLVIAMLKHFDVISSQKVKALVGTAALVSCVALMCPIHMAREKLTQAYDSLLHQAEQQRDGLVCAKEYANLVNSPFAYSFFSRYTQMTAANSVIYSANGIRNLSNYIVKIKEGNKLEKVLPDSIENIVSQCTSDICSFDSYFVVRKHSVDSDLLIRLIEKPELLFSKLLTKFSNSDYRIKRIRFSNLQIKFQYQEWEYGIIYKYSDNGYVITDVDTN